MRVDAFDYDLPADLIAQRPAVPRDAARLLHIAPDRDDDRAILDLPSLLDPGDLLVVNDTRVIPARLRGTRGEARIEVTLHRRTDPARWMAFARPAKRLRDDDTIRFGGGLEARVVRAPVDGEVELEFNRGGTDLDMALHVVATMPLPPYIRGGVADEADLTDYQTMFAARPGAVAAPTAALHFTPALIRALQHRGVEIARLTLHVGAGTFLPVKAADTSEHRMHREWGRIPRDTALAVARAKRRGSAVVAVGTTAMRLLEQAGSEDGTVVMYEGATILFITPGYRFKVVDRLLTNFHLPRSTLMMLVAAFAGLERIQAAYAHAIAAGYRFYSYGDACLIDRAAL